MSSLQALLSQLFCLPGLGFRGGPLETCALELIVLLGFRASGPSVSDL